MVLRLANPVARLSLVVVAVVLTAAFAFFGIRNARADHQADLGTLAGYQRATQLEPSNPQNWYLLGHFLQYGAEEADTKGAIAAYLKSLDLDPRSADTYLDLATAYETEDDIANARNAFLNAKRVYPLSGEVAWRYGNFLLRQAELPEAFAQIHQAVLLDPKYGGQAFSRSWRADPDIDLILNSVLPADPNVYLAALRELEPTREVAPAMAIWPRLVALHPHLKLNDVFFLTDMLIAAQHTADAWQVWNDAQRLSGMQPPPDPPNSILWDGGFETGVRGAGFAWILSPNYGGAQVVIDTRQKHSGNASLRIIFDGRHNINFENVCHTVAVQPGASYRFSAWVRTEGVTTDQGVRFRLAWMESSTNRTAQTEDVRETEPWTKIELPWTAGKDTQRLNVCVVRLGSAHMDSDVAGTAWIDDVSLEPEQPRPESAK
jgi:hypothetical protein